MASESSWPLPVMYGSLRVVRRQITHNTHANPFWPISPTTRYSGHTTPGRCLWDHAYGHGIGSETTDLVGGQPLQRQQKQWLLPADGPLLTLRTSFPQLSQRDPYHPQARGIVERWSGGLPGAAAGKVLGKLAASSETASLCHPRWTPTLLDECRRGLCNG